MHSPDEDYDSTYKIIIVGEAAVGKTNIITKYISGKTPKHVTSTIGAEYATKIIQLENGGIIKAQIWDTAGQERYRSMTSTHFRNASGAMLVYDVTNEKSFFAVRKWMNELRELGEPDIVITLIGNKIDLCKENPSYRRIHREDAMNFARQNGMLFEETSVLPMIGVQEAFGKLVQTMFERRIKVSLREEGFNIEKYLFSSGKQRGNCCSS